MKNILLVCTGNTCRSPMAETMLDSAVDESEILDGIIKTDSAGTFAFEDGEPAQYAKMVMKEMGLSIDRHKAKQIDQDLVDWADLILAMDSYGLEQMQVMFPEAEDKLTLFKSFAKTGKIAVDEEDRDSIEDPYGEDLETYRECAEEIKRYVDKLVIILEEIHG